MMMNLAIIVYVQENNICYNLFSASFGGVAVSWVVAVITYFTEERKIIYNFYVAADRYTEKLRCFSHFLAESYMCLENEKYESDKLKTRCVVLNRLERIFDELYEEYIVIQRETREFEAYHIKNTKRYDIKWYMREFYDSTKAVVNCIRSCEEIDYHNKLREKNNYDKVEFIYNKLCSFFLERDNNKFILIKCKHLDYILDKFIVYGFMALRKGGKVIRNSEYEIISSNKNIKFSNGLVQDEFSVKYEPYPYKHEDNDWLNDI